MRVQSTPLISCTQNMPQKTFNVKHSAGKVNLRIQKLFSTAYYTSILMDGF